MSAEAAISVFGARSRLRLLVVLAALAGTSLSILALFDWADLRVRTDELRDDGWTTIVVTAGQFGTGIDRRSCQETGALAGVQSVTAIGRTYFENFVQLGSRTVPVVEVGTSDPELLQLVGVSGQHSGAAIGEEISAAVTDVRYLDNGRGVSLEVVGVVPRLIALADLNQSVVIPVPIAQFTKYVTSCVAVVDPSEVGFLAQEIPAGLRIGSFQVLSRAVGSAPATHPYDGFLARPGRYAALAVGGFLGLVWALTLRARASDLGVYRVSGATKSHLFFLLGCELLLVNGVWILAGATSAIAISWLRPLPADATWPYQMLGVAITTLVGSLFSATALHREVTALLKDR